MKSQSLRLRLRFSENILHVILTRAKLADQINVCIDTCMYSLLDASKEQFSQALGQIANRVNYNFITNLVLVFSHS